MESSVSPNEEFTTAEPVHCPNCRGTTVIAEPRRTLKDRIAWVCWRAKFRCRICDLTFYSRVEKAPGEYE
jgi:hypothetical protein